MDDRARVRVDWPLAPCAGGFRVMLAEQGCAQLGGRLLQLVAHLSRWLAQMGRSADQVTAAAMEQFLQGRKAAGYRWWLSARGIAPLREYCVPSG